MKYGPNSAQVEKLIARIGAMSEVEISNSRAEYDAARIAARVSARYAAQEASLVEAYDAARDAAWIETWSAEWKTECISAIDDARMSACDAAAAEMALGLISTLHYEILIDPLRSAIGDW